MKLDTHFAGDVLLWLRAYDEKTSTLSDVVRQPCTLITGASSELIGGTVAGFARPRRAVKPQCRMAARRRRGA
jgi:hypothetical protein